MRSELSDSLLSHAAADWWVRPSLEEVHELRGGGFPVKFRKYAIHATCRKDRGRQYTGSRVVLCVSDLLAGSPWGRSTHRLHFPHTVWVSVRDGLTAAEYLIEIVEVRIDIS